MAVDALKCKECGRQYPLEAKFVCEDCFGPLEVSYDFTNVDVEEAKRTIQSGPQHLAILRFSSVRNTPEVGA